VDWQEDGNVAVAEGSQAARGHDTAHRRTGRRRFSRCGVKAFRHCWDAVPAHGSWGRYSTVIRMFRKAVV
jgi:hypothetical protein